MGKDERKTGQYYSSERIPIPDIGPDLWPELKIDDVGFVCFANMGRSIMAEAIAMAARDAGRFPPKLRFFSGALRKTWIKPVEGPPYVVIHELKSRGHEKIIPRLKTEPLSNYNWKIGNETDLVFFVDGSLIETLLPEHVGINTEIRSKICVPLADPSNPPYGATIESEVTRTYDKLHYFINHELLGIIYNVRNGNYSNSAFRSEYINNGIIYPFGYKPPEVPDYIRHSFW